MALLSTTTNPFTGIEITNAYFKMKDFAFQSGVSGRIGFMAFRSEADRIADRMPYPLPHQAVNIECADPTLPDPIFQYIADILASTPDFVDCTQDGPGFIKSYTDPYGETHDQAYWAPTFVEAQISNSSVLIRVGIYASKVAYDSGIPSFPVSATTALGGNITIQNQDGSTEPIPQNTSLPDFDTFISGLDEVGGRPALYDYAKTQNLFVDNFIDC